MSMKDIGSYRSFYNELRNELFISVSFSFEEVLENIKNPVWDDVWDNVWDNRCWKNYILPPTRRRWSNLSMETKIVLVILAEKQANDEEYE